MRVAGGLAAALAAVSVSGCGQSRETPPAAQPAPPPPVESTSPMPINRETFACPGGQRLTADFQVMPDLATVTLSGGGFENNAQPHVYRLPIAVSGFGYRYESASVAFTGSGDVVRLARAGQPDLVCQRAPAP